LLLLFWIWGGDRKEEVVNEIEGGRRGNPLAKGGDDQPGRQSGLWEHGAHLACVLSCRHDKAVLLVHPPLLLALLHMCAARLRICCLLARNIAHVRNCSARTCISSRVPTGSSWPHLLIPKSPFLRSRSPMTPSWRSPGTQLPSPGESW
jgi:hypothetical protein